LTALASRSLKIAGAVIILQGILFLIIGDGISLLLVFLTPSAWVFVAISTILFSGVIGTGVGLLRLKRWAYIVACLVAAADLFLWLGSPGIAPGSDLWAEVIAGTLPGFSVAIGALLLLGWPALRRG